MACNCGTGKYCIRCGGELRERRTDRFDTDTGLPVIEKYCPVSDCLHDGHI